MLSVGTQPRRSASPHRVDAERPGGIPTLSVGTRERELSKYAETWFTMYLDYKRQNVLVAGHMTISGGYKIVAKNHLRLASGHHAKPFKAGQYLMFDASKSIERAEDLLEGLGNVF